MRTKYLLLALLSAPTFALACASCGCSLSSDWESQGLTSAPGWRLDPRYSYINQSQLRSGADKTDRSTFAPFPQSREIEQVTTNRYTTLGIDYSPNKIWGFNLQLPYIDRFHQTVVAGDTDISESRTHEIGDMRFTARYQGFSALRNLGFDAITPELQLNIVHSGHDRGANADEPNSSGGALYLSPGVTLSLNKRTSVYGFVQLPLFQDVEGLQLAPRWTATAGIRHAF